MATYSAKYTIIDCHERQAVDLPVQSLLGSDGNLNILPELKTRGYFDIDYRGDKLTFVAGRFVGLIPINEDICINVKPKIHILDLARLIAIAGGDIEVLRFFKRGYERHATQEIAIVPILLRTLLEQLREVESEGMLIEYRPFEGEGVFRNRIDFGKTIHHQWARGRFASASWKAFLFTNDNAANRLIKYTLWYCGKLLDSCRASGDLREQLAEVYSFFDQVSLDPQQGFLRQIRHLLENDAIPMVRHYYREVCNTCLFIIGNDSVSLKMQGTDIDLLSFVLNLEDLFEKFVRNVLQRSLSAPGLRVLDGNREGRSYLFCDSRTMEVRPDIVIKGVSSTLLIADVKYKVKVNEGDRYQLIAHAYSAGVRRALFVLPSYEAGQSGLVRRGQILDKDGLEIFEYYMRLDTDIEAQEGALVNCVAGLI